ncbi:hypothetical protein PQO01_04710 [Lentisphaera marina]|uniref:hypothetical protein n=1 Tax=Lentisphaera marina TaxID=1111041 RepID=UPI0023664F5A|nr:hypothetical protein [Lentisphaera marina]MDD7984246.1 hypothetical protein [Lentisphaera marina]
MKHFVFFITLCFGLIAEESTTSSVDPFWIDVKEGFSIYLTQRYVDEGETPENIKLAIYMNRLSQLTTGKGIDIKKLLVQAPTECDKRLIDNGLQLQTILSDKYNSLENTEKSEAIKLLIALVCDNIGQLDQNLLSELPVELVENRVSKIHRDYSEKYGLHLESPKDVLVSQLENISFRSLSFNTSQLFLLINYINKKCKPLGISLEIDSLPFCEDLKSSFNSEDEVIYSGSLQVKKPISFKLEDGNLMDLINIIDLHYRVQLSYSSNKIIIKSPDESHWKHDLLSYRQADALSAMLFSPVYDKVHKKNKTFQIYGQIQKVINKESSSTIYLNPYLSVEIPYNQNEELIDNLSIIAEKNENRKSSLYSEKLKVIIQGDFVANSGSATKVELIYLPSYGKFFKLL